MTSRAHTTFGGVFFVSKSHLGTRDKRNLKNCNFVLKASSHVKM